MSNQNALTTTNFAGDYQSTSTTFDVVGNYGGWSPALNYPFPVYNSYPYFWPTYYPVYIPVATDHEPRIAELEGQVKVLRELLAAAITIRATPKKRTARTRKARR